MTLEWNKKIEWRELLVSQLTWHVAGVAVLAVLVAVLATRLALDWSATSGNKADATAGKRVELAAIEHTTAPLRGLDQRVADSRRQIQDFYAARIPANYSLIAARIGALSVASSVHLTRVQYSQGAPTGDLTEITLDAGVSGAYPEIMKFVNGLERDKTFFVIRAMALTGQQGGLVNLRLRVSTWLHSPDAAASGLPQTEEAAPAATAQEGQ